MTGVQTCALPISSTGGHDASVRQTLQDDLVGNLGKVGALHGDDAGAVGGIADPVVFFEHEHVEPGLGAARSREQASRSCPGDDEVVHGERL